MSRWPKWAQLSRLDRGVAIGVLGLVAFSLSLRTGWDQIDPQPRVSRIYHAPQTPRNEWGHEGGPNLFWFGPDGERGGGDDVWVLPEGHARLFIYGWLPWATLGFALLSGLTYAFSRQEERTSLGDEVGRSFVTAIPLSGYAAVWMLVLCTFRDGSGAPLVLIDRLRQQLFVHPSLALPASGWILCMLAVLAVRLQQPRLDPAQLESWE